MLVVQGSWHATREPSLNRRLSPLTGKRRFALTASILGCVAACGLSDAETTWCADNKTEVLTAAENLGLVELDVAYRPITGRELLTRVGAGEIQSAHIRPGNVLARTNDGEMLLGDLEFLDADQIVEAMAEAWTMGGSEGEPITIVETPAELIPLTGADFDRACVAAFEAR